MARLRTTTRSSERPIAPGVVERHQGDCASLRLARAACDCSPGYRARVRTGARGQQRTISRTFGSLAEAVTWITEAKTLQRAGEHPRPREPVPTLSEGARDFLMRARAGKALNRSGRRFASNTIDNYERALRVHVLEFVSNRTGKDLKDLPVDEIDARMIQAMVNHLAVEASPAIARAAEASLSAVLRDLFAREIIDQQPSRPALPSPPPGREKYLTIAEADRLLAAAAADDDRQGCSLMGPLIAVLIATGCRISEALALTWGSGGIDLDGELPTVTVLRQSTKTDAGVRRIGIEREYSTHLELHRQRSGGQVGGLVFADRQGNALSRDGRVRSGLRRVGRQAGLGNIGFHVLRHSQGSWLSAAGETAVEIAARLGHSDPAFTLRRYVHADVSRVSGAPSALASLREQARTSPQGEPD